MAADALPLGLVDADRISVLLAGGQVAPGTLADIQSRVLAAAPYTPGAVLRFAATCLAYLPDALTAEERLQTLFEAVGNGAVSGLDAFTLVMEVIMPDVLVPDVDALVHLRLAKVGAAMDVPEFSAAELPRALEALGMDGVPEVAWPTWTSMGGVGGVSGGSGCASSAGVSGAEVVLEVAEPKG